MSLPAALPLHVLLPLLGGFVYVAAAMSLKRAADLGADVWRTARICNFTTAIVFAPLLLLGGTIPSWQLFWQPAVVALLFMSGQIFTVLALKAGDVSLATPVLGVKIPLVALLTTALLGERISPNLWTAALLSTIAIALLNFTRTQAHHRVGTTILLATGAAASYALLDVLVQKWSPAWGAGRFLPIMTGFLAVASCALPSFRSSRTAPKQNAVLPGSSRWVMAGAVLLALQAIMIVSSIALYGQATIANILYSSRGLWSVLGVWLVGHWFGNRERHHGWRVAAWRFVGAALLMAAILIAVRNNHQPVTSSRYCTPIDCQNIIAP